MSFGVKGLTVFLYRDNTKQERCHDGFGNLEVSVLAFGIQVRGFEVVGFFRGKKSLARLPLEGK
jgi:hypothetical protein